MKKRKIKKAQIQCYIILFIPIIGFLAFYLYPLLWAARWSFFDYNGLPSSVRFVGIRNFIEIFTKDDSYWESWLVTLKFAIYKIPLEIPLALFIALLLSKDKLKGAGFFRAVFYLPCVISAAIVGVMFTNLFSYFGTINALLKNAGVINSSIDWFSDRETSMMVMVLSHTWMSFGTNVLFFIAALSNVPKDLYEAAELDGAGKIKKFFKVTLPVILPTFKIILLLSINGTLHIGDFVIALTNGAPSGETYTVGAYLINAFVPGFATGLPNIGYGSALSLITSAIYCVIAIFYMKLTKKMSNVY